MSIIATEFAKTTGHIQLNILRIPRNSRERIFRLLDDNSLLCLREISKAAKSIVDDSILNVRDTNIFLTIECYQTLSSKFCGLLRCIKTQEKINKICFKVHCPCTEIDSSLWEIALKHTINLLACTNFKPALERKVDFGVIITMDMKNVGAFLEFLKSRIAGVDIIILNLFHINVDIIRAVTNFLEDKIVSYIKTDEIRLNNSYSTPWVNLLSTAKVRDFECFEIHKHSLKIICDVSVIVDRLAFTIMDKLATNIQVNLVKEIISRRCFKLEINSMNAFSVHDIENLVSFFNRSQKKIMFETRTYLEPINRVQIGVYTIEMNDSLANPPLMITHLEAKEQ